MTHKHRPPIDVGRLPQAHAVRIYFCEGPECCRPHVVLFDERDRAIAQFVLPDPRPDGTSWLGDLVNAAMESIAMRNGTASEAEGPAGHA
jgi:hypothetical protein